MLYACATFILILVFLLPTAQGEVSSIPTEFLELPLFKELLECGEIQASMYCDVANSLRPHDSPSTNTSTTSASEASASEASASAASASGASASGASSTTQTQELDEATLQSRAATLKVPIHVAKHITPKNQALLSLSSQRSPLQDPVDVPRYCLAQVSQVFNAFIRKTHSTQFISNILLVLLVPGHSPYHGSDTQNGGWQTGGV